MVETPAEGWTGKWGRRIGSAGKKREVELVAAHPSSPSPSLGGEVPEV
jgi:hypothetical protein